MSQINKRLRTALSFNTLIVILLLITGGCDRRVVFDQNLEVNPNGWENRRFMRYTFNIQDTAIPYNFYVNIRNNTDYSYSNLFLFIRTILPDQTTAQDTIDLAIAGPDGKWYGKGIGKHRDSQVLLMPQFRFPQRGEYTFEIEHAMRERDLKGISSVGIRVERSDIKSL
jgi:gliding motility-associated lipoprotein GldH